MKKLIFLAAIAVVVSAAPARTQDREHQERFGDRVERFEDRLEDNGFFFDQDGFFNRTRFDDRFDEDGFSYVAGISQQLEKETGSGDSDRSFTVSGAEDSSNQCVGISGAVNTGNVQTATGFIQYASNVENFEQDNVSSELMVDDNSSDVACEQQVNQASAG